MAPRKKKPAPAGKAVKKPVINLKATEVKSATEKAAERAQEKAAEKVKMQSAPSSENKKSESKKPEDKKPVQAAAGKKKSKKTGLVLVGLAALIAAGIGGAWAFKTYGAKYFADPNAVKSEQLATVVARLQKLEAASGASTSTGTEAKELALNLEKQISVNSKSVAANQTTLNAITEKLAGLEKTAGEIRVALAKAVEDGQGPVAVANELQFQQLTQKLTGLEEGLKNLTEAPVSDNSAGLDTLKTRFDAFLIRLSAAEEETAATAKSIGIVKTAQEKFASAPASNPASELARAFTVLRAKISQGEAFATELDVVAGQLPEETTLDVLRPFAKAGVPTLAGLSKALDEVDFAPVVPASDQTKGKDSGMLGALTDRLSGLVKVTRAGDTDWPALKQQAVQALAGGQLEAAAQMLAGATGGPKGVAAWLDMADKKIKVDQAVKNLSGKIVARLTPESG